MLRSLLVAAFALGLASLFPEAANAACPPGFVSHPAIPSFCIEEGSDPCLNEQMFVRGTYCKPGSHCCANREQCEATTPKGACIPGPAVQSQLYDGSRGGR